VLILAAGSTIQGYSATAAVMTFVFPVLLFATAMAWLFFQRGRR
jgi:hypothetical protein